MNMRLAPTHRLGTVRQGTILIIAAGISALMASLALAFLVRMRSDVEESLAVVQEAQAHIMQVAACNFIMESARLGWDPKLPNGSRSTVRRESFGWVDVRTGKAGPRGEDGERLGPVNASGSPIMASDGQPKWFPWTDLTLPDAQRPAKRGEMYVMRRPPFAVSPQVAVNPIQTTGADAFMPYTLRADPQRFQEGMTTAQFEDSYIKGDPTIDNARYVPSWFRVWRASPATFVITCGVGETLGYRTWAEVVTANETGRFGGFTTQAQELFEYYQHRELRLWYLVEWSAHVGGHGYAINIALESFLNSDDDERVESYLQLPYNMSNDFQTDFTSTTTTVVGPSRSQGKLPNPVGTIRMIQRLSYEPRYW